MTPLPQELIDRILDEVHADDDLRTCALVSRAWRASSGRHLFSDLVFDSPPDSSPITASPCHTFLGLMRAAPDLARHVRHIEVWDESRSCDQHRPWFTESADVFLQTISHFTGLVSLDLSFCGKWWNELKEVSGTLRTVFATKSLVRISIDDIFEIPLDDLFALFRNSCVRELSLSNLDISPPSPTPLHDRYHLILEVLVLSLTTDYHARTFSEGISSIVDLSITKKLSLSVANATEALVAGTLLENPVFQSVDTLEVQALNCFAHVDKRDNPLPPLFMSFPSVALTIYETAGCFNEPYVCGSAVNDIVLWWTRSFEALPPEVPRVEDISLTFSQRSASQFHTVVPQAWHKLDAAMALGLPGLKRVTIKLDDTAGDIDGILLYRFLGAFPLLCGKRLLNFTSS